MRSQRRDGLRPPDKIDDPISKLFSEGESDPFTSGIAATVLNEEKTGAYFRLMIQESTEKIPAPPRVKDSKPAIYNKTTS